MTSLGSEQKTFIPGMRTSSGAPAQLESPLRATPAPKTDWRRQYTAATVVLDLVAALFAAALALLVRFGGSEPAGYAPASFALPLLWVGAVAVTRAYEHRFIGTGTE